MHVETLNHDLRHALSVSPGGEQNGMPIDNVAQYLYPALGWRHRSRRGGRVRPRRSPARVRFEVNTHEKRGQHTHLSKNTCRVELVVLPDVTSPDQLGEVKEMISRVVDATCNLDDKSFKELQKNHANDLKKFTS